jgi:hypothetical protein
MDMYRAREYLFRAAHILHRHDLRLPSLAHYVQKDAGRTEMLRADETIGVLGQLFFMDIAQNLLFNFPVILAESVVLELSSIHVRLAVCL